MLYKAQEWSVTGSAAPLPSPAQPARVERDRLVEARKGCRPGSCGDGAECLEQHSDPLRSHCPEDQASEAVLSR